MKLPKITIIVLIIWGLAQIICFFLYKDITQVSDAQTYRNLALQCFDYQTWYPDSAQIFSDYIFNPGYVNYLILHLNFFNSFAFVPVFNIIFNFLIIFELFILGKHFFNKNSAFIAVILFCALPTNALLPVVNLTEIPFLATALGAICLVRKKRYLSLIFAGALFFIANWIRPIVIVFLLPVLLYMFLHKFNVRSYVFLLFPLIISIFIIGEYTKIHTGYFNWQATSGGLNLIIGANDGMNGRHSTIVFRKGNMGYIENKERFTYTERDSIWKSRSINWIRENPVKYAEYIPLKIFRMWRGDNFLYGNLLQKDGKIIPKKQRIFSDVCFGLPYYLIISMFFLSLALLWKEKDKNLFILLLPLVLGTLLQGLIYGSPRYHYPYMPVILIFAAWRIEIIIKNRKKFYISKLSVRFNKSTLYLSKKE